MMRRGVLLTSTCAVAATLAAGAIAYAATESQARLERLNVRETVLSAEQGRNLNRMARLLTALAQFRRDPPPALLVSPGDATDAVRAAILVKAITPELQKRAKVYAAEAGEIARQRRLAAVASEALFTSDSNWPSAASSWRPPRPARPRSRAARSPRRSACWPRWRASWSSVMAQPWPGAARPRASPWRPGTAPRSLRPTPGSSSL